MTGVEIPATVLSPTIKALSAVSIAAPLRVTVAGTAAPSHVGPAPPPRQWSEQKYPAPASPTTIGCLSFLMSAPRSRGAPTGPASAVQAPGFWLNRTVPPAPTASPLFPLK